MMMNVGRDVQIANLCAELEAVHVRHFDIDQEEVGWVRFGSCKGFGRG